MTMRLNRLVTFRRKAEVNTGLGLTETWADIGRAWAHRADGAVSETGVAGTIEATATVRFVVRRNDVTLGLRPADALLDRGVTFGLIGIKEMPRRDMLEITAEARADL